MEADKDNNPDVEVFKVTRFFLHTLQYWTYVLVGFSCLALMRGELVHRYIYIYIYKYIVFSLAQCDDNDVEKCNYKLC